MIRKLAWIPALFILWTVVLPFKQALAYTEQCSEIFREAENIRPSPAALTLAKIHYVLLGAKHSGDPILFVHGVGASLETFREVASELSKTRKVILFDLRGHGESFDPESGYDLPTMISDLEVLVSSLKLRRVQLVGHSAGAKIAMLFADRHPDLVSAVVAEDSGVFPLAVSSPDEQSRVQHEARFLRSLNDSYASVNQLAPDLLPITDNQPGKAMELAKKVFPIGPKKSAVIAEFWKNFKGTDASHFLIGYRKPVLFLRAEPATRYFPLRDVEAIKNTMSRAKIVSISEGSHTIHEKKPEIWLSTVKQFLDSN